MQELTALQWFNQELQKNAEINNYGLMIIGAIDYTSLLLKAFEIQEKQHKQSYEAGIDQCIKHVDTGESLYEFQYYFDKKFYI
jgi:hypothetical protein